MSFALSWGGSLGRRAARLLAAARRSGTSGPAVAACVAAGGASLAWAEPQAKPRLQTLRTYKTQKHQLDNDYELGERLGTGTYGSVYRGRCKRTGRTVAIKVVPRTGDDRADNQVRAEVRAMRRVALHPAISEIYEFYESLQDFYIVMEYIDGGELLDHLVDNGPFSEPRAAALVSQVAGAIALLHAQGLCHSDIKPENLVLTKEGQVRLIDFGLTFAVDAKLDKALNQQQPQESKGADAPAKVRGGTVQYFAPETIGQRSVGLPSDLWALGVARRPQPRARPAPAPPLHHAPPRAPARPAPRGAARRLPLASIRPRPSGRVHPPLSSRCSS